MNRSKVEKCPSDGRLMRVLPKAVSLILCCCTFASQVTLGQKRNTCGNGSHLHRAGQRSQRTPSSSQVMLSKLRISVPDIPLLDQNGKKVLFYTDLVKDRVVILGFSYTTCTFVCQYQGQAFAKLQAKLGDRLGKDVYFILATRDPETDTPRELKKWSARYGVRRGWTLVTGSAENMNKLLEPFTHDRVGKVEGHTSTIFIGNDKDGMWYATSGLYSTKGLVELIGGISAGNSSPVKLMNSEHY